jgi:hypothetical protein
MNKKKERKKERKKEKERKKHENAQWFDLCVTAGSPFLEP